MASANPDGQMQFWFEGLPFGGVKLTPNDMGQIQFWFDGLPGRFLFPQEPQVMVVPGVAIRQKIVINSY